MAGIDWLTGRPIAHRGYHDRVAGRIENTLAAAEAAIDRTFAIECDLQLSADGHPVVFHDDTLDRLTEASGPVRAKRLAELKAVRFREGEGRIPTLSDLLDTVQGRVPLVIELKSDWSGDRRLEEGAAPILAAYAGPAVVMSFDPASMRAMRRLLQKLPRGLVADHFDADPDWSGLSPLRRFALRHLLAAVDVAPSFISYGAHALPAPAPWFLRRAVGMPLITWTIRSRAEWARARRYADQITFEGFDPDA